MYDPEALPELRKSKNPAERRNDFDMVKAKLMGRSPLPREEWLERYDERFVRLSRNDDAFRELILSVDESSEKMLRLQEALDAQA